MKSQRHPVAILTLSIKLVLPGIAEASSSNIEHVVLCWLEHPDKKNRAKVIETTRELAAIPGVMNLRVGPVLPNEREVVDDSFDVGISMTFRNREDMENYVNHDKHVRRLKEVFLPLCEKIRIHDFSF